MVVTNIKELREKSGLSQRSLSIQSGVSQPRISQYEAGKELPTPDTCFKLAKILGCQWHDLLTVKE